MKTKELNRELYEKIHVWMKKHERADEIVVGEISGLPLKAIYYCPVVKFTEDEIEEMASKNEFIKALVETRKNKMANK